MADGPQQELTIVSNRLPVVLNREEGRWQVEAGSGGLVQAMAPLLERRGGRWVGWPGVTQEEGEGWTSSLARVSRSKGYDLMPVVLSREEYEGYYEGFSNSVVWPLFHGFSSRCDFDPAYARVYEEVNQRFAQVIVDEVVSEGLIWVHDYHLMALGRALREKGQDGQLAFFLHIPFPTPEVFARLPGGDGLIEDLLAYDQVGFQTDRDRKHFEACVEQRGAARVIERGEATHFEVKGRQMRCGAYPIGIDADDFESRARRPEVASRAEELIRELGDREVLLGVDRLDYSKGLIQRLEAWERTLEEEPGLHEKAVLFQLLVPSRENVEEYRLLKERFDQLVGRINGRFGTSVWQPIHYRYSGVGPEELSALYRMARVALVTPLCDGMNLVAKEYCISQVDDPGVLILSEFAGAAEQLRESAMMINPYDTEGSAEAIVEALHLGRAERQRRMDRAREVIHDSDVYSWAASFLGTLGKVGKESSRGQIDQRESRNLGSLSESRV